MEKLLHERLREYAKTLNPMRTARECEEAPDDAKLFRLLADEIERYYIPRPRFEDGEPVQFGDETEILKHVDAILYKADGAFELHKKKEVGGGTIVNIYEQDEFVKRPQPKVLDADGVEINVGDTVWHVRGDGTWPYRVVDIKEGTVACIPPKCPGMTAWQDPKDLTHKEPDSLEKLRDDIRCYKGSHSQWADRLSALIERGA